MKHTKKLLLLTLALLLAFSAAACGKGKAPDWVRNAPQTPEAMVAKLQAEGYTNIVDMSYLSDYLSGLGGAGLEGLGEMSGFVTARKGDTYFVAFFFGSEQLAKAFFNTFGTEMKAEKKAVKEVKGLKVKKDSITYKDGGVSCYIYLSGKVLVFEGTDRDWGIDDDDDGGNYSMGNSWPTANVASGIGGAGRLPAYAETGKTLMFNCDFENNCYVGITVLMGATQTGVDTYKASLKVTPYNYNYDEEDDVFWKKFGDGEYVLVDIGFLYGALNINAQLNDYCDYDIAD
ncbi:MAG: hypothetical protein FWE62_01480 [Firmicutes bacterium]|nr:hypothetical protein [Bacillota bacterium]